MKPLNSVCSTLLALALTACGSDSADPVPMDDGVSPDIPGAPEAPGVPDNPAQPGIDPTIPANLVTPTYQGELSFSQLKTVELDSFLAEEGLKDVNASSSLAQDGKSVRLEITDDTGFITAIAKLDTDSGNLTWLATGISPKTRILFDANNKPVAVAGYACQGSAYTQWFEGTLVDLTPMVPSSRCISVSPSLSANGNVVIFSTYNPQQGSEFLASDQVINAYTLDTANLVQLPVPELERNGTTLSVRPLGQVGRDTYLSDDGARFLRKTWWEGTDANGETVREVGALLWDTATGKWQTRGLTPDLRDCTPTDKVSCTPPYSYAMSYDGNVQYSMVPTDQLFDPNNVIPFSPYSTLVEKTETTSETSTVLPGVRDTASLTTNNDGSLLLFFNRKATNAMAAGYNLYQPATGEFVSLNRALNACPENDEAGNAIEVGNCTYTSVPSSITNVAETFTADGNSVVIQSLSRFSENAGQEVESLILGADTGHTYSLPANFIANPDRISADASVMLWQSNFPEYNLLIGIR